MAELLILGGPVPHCRFYNGKSGMDMSTMVEIGAANSTITWTLITPISGKPYIKMLDSTQNITISIFQMKKDKQFQLQFYTIQPTCRDAETRSWVGAIQKYIQLLERKLDFVNISPP